MAFYEVNQGKALDQVDRDEWTGIRAWLCNDSEVSTLSRLLWDNLFPSLTGIFTPRVYKTSAHYEPYGVPGTALVVAYYHTKPIPGKAIIYTSMSPVATKVLVDRKRNIIRGPLGKINSSTSLPMTEWRIYQGDNTVYDGRCQFRVVTAIYRDDYSDEALWSIRGTVNGAPFDLAGRKPPETLLFMGYSSTDRYRQEPIDIEYIFDYDPAGWNTHLYSQLGSWMIEKQPDYDALGIATGSTSKVLVFRPGWDSKTSKKTEPELREPHIAANWNAILNNSTW